jgi:hypothetical protein
MKMQTETFPLFLIGKNSRGHWVAQKQHGQCGGLFVSRAAALKFALFENGNRPEAVITVPGALELDMGRPALTVVRSTLDAGGRRPARTINRPALPQAA